MLGIVFIVQVGQLSGRSKLYRQSPYPSFLNKDVVELLGKRKNMIELLPEFGYPKIMEVYN